MVPLSSTKNVQSNTFSIDLAYLNETRIESSVSTWPVGGFNQNKVFPASTTKIKEEKRQRKVLKGQNYLRLRGKY